MATNIFNFDGSLLTTVADGTLDQTHSSIKIPGKGYQNYGEPVMESLLWVMQNFSGTSAPPNPSTGQLWYDTTTGASILKVWTGSQWVVAGGVIASDTAPATGNNQGALWYDTRNKQLNDWNGSNWDLVGPLGSKINTDPLNPAIPVNSVVEAMRVLAVEDGLPRQIWRITVGGTMLAILSKDPVFTPQTTILTNYGFAKIYPGINFNSTIDGVGLAGDTTIFKSTQSNFPAVNVQYDLGSNSKKFNNIFGANGIFNNIGVNVTPSQYALEVNGTTKFDSTVTLGPGSTTKAPALWSAGGLLETPAIGAVEFDGNNFYFTGLLNGKPTRRIPKFDANTLNSNTLYVSPQGDDGNDGRSRTSPYKTVKRATKYLTDNNLTGYSILLESGDYLENNPIYVPPKTSIVGDNLRRVTIRPAHDQLDLFHVNVNTFFFGMTFRDHRAPAFCFAFPCSTATAVINTTVGSPNYGTVTQILPTYSQSGYDIVNPPDVFVEAPHGTTGTQAVYRAVVVDGGIVDISVTNGGTGYSSTNAPGVTISGGSGYGAIARARVSDRAYGDVVVGSVVGIDIIDPGQGYTAPIAVSIAPPSANGSVTASATATVADGVIRSYDQINAGAGYTSVPWVSVKGVAPPVITSSPYVQNCSSITGPFDKALTGVSPGGKLITVPPPYDQSGRDPAGTGYGPVDVTGAGGGIRIDGEVVDNHPERGTIIRSFVADSFTQINQGGIGHLIINRGYAQFVSCFTTFSSVGYWARSGGFANISNSVIDFGDVGLKAEGCYPIPYTTGTVHQNYSSSVSSVELGSGGGGYNGDFTVIIKDVDDAVPPNTVWVAGGGNRRASAHAVVKNGVVIEVVIDDVGVGYTGVPIVDFITFATGTPTPGTGAVGTAGLDVNEDIQIDNLTSKPQVGSAMLLNGIWYTVTHTPPGFGGGTCVVTIQDKNGNGVISANVAAEVRFFDISNISSGGLALEYVGTGVTYNALPRYGGIPDADKQVVDRSTDEGLYAPGVVYYVTISNDGNFRIGPYFSVNFVDGTLKFNPKNFSLAGIDTLGPFKRGGVAAREISDDPKLTHTNTSKDHDTLPTQYAVRGYFEQVNSDILPNFNDRYNLGSSSYKWHGLNSNLLAATTGTITTLTATDIHADTVYSGSFSGATVNFTGDVTIGGSLTVNGTQNIVNTTTLAIKDPNIDLGTNTDNAPLTVDDTLDRGLTLHYYNTTAVRGELQGNNSAFLGRSRASGELIFKNNLAGTPIWGPIQVGASTVNGGLTVTGDINAAGDITGFYLSDQRLKTNVEKIPDALNKVNALTGVTFDWNALARESRPARTKREAGVLAQEVEKVIPEVVNTRLDGYKAVDYDKLVPLLIEAIKELSDKVERLEKNK